MFYCVIVNAETTSADLPAGAVVGCFMTRWVAAKDAIVAGQRAEAKVRAKLAAMNIWPAFRTIVDQVTTVSLVDYTLKKMKEGGATWYSKLDDR